MKVSWMMLLAAAFAGPLFHRLLDGGDAVLRTDDGSDRDQPGSDPDSNIRTFFLHEKLNARIYLGIIIVIAGAIVAGYSGGIGCGEQLYTRYHPGIHGTHWIRR